MGEATRVRLAVFDMVGTTVHAGDEVPAAFRKAMRSVGVELSDEAIAGIRGRSKRDAIADLLVAFSPHHTGEPEQVEVVYDRFQTALRAEYGTRARPVPAAEGVFLRLRDAGVETVLNTGLDRETAELLVRGLGWDALDFLGLVTGDDVDRGRPAPDLIHAAMRLKGVDDARAVVAVGDTTSDLDAAAAAGVGWSVGVLSGAHSRTQLEGHPHSVILPSVEDVPGWLADVGALAAPRPAPAEARSHGEGRVIPLERGDAPRVVGVMSDAFHDYPVMRFVLGEPGDDYEERLRRLVGLFVMARAIRDEPLLGVPGGADLAAAAIVSFPDRTESPPELASLREEVWTDLGEDARARYEACGEAWRPLGVTVPHIHLNMIGVRGAFQGRGYARLLLDHVHRMSRETEGSLGVTLTTEDPANVPLYRRMGYEVVGHARVAENLETWGFFRRD